MKGLSQILKISWIERKTNEWVIGKSWTHRIVCKS